MKKRNKTEEYKPIISFQKLITGAAWLRIPYALFRFLPDTESKILAYLMDRHTTWDSRPEYRRMGGWYFHTDKKLLKILNIPASTQHRAFSNLTKKGLLEMKRDGPFRRRYVRLIPIEIAKMVDQYSLPLEGPEKEEETQEYGMGG